MALPAIRLLARNLPVTVLCRPDCAFLFEGLGVAAVPFACPFFARPSPGNLWRTLRNAWALRGRIRGPALDLDADPRSAFFLKVAGIRDVRSYRREFGWLFDRTFPLPREPSSQGPSVGAPGPGVRHQSLINLAAAEGFLRDAGIAAAGTEGETADPKPATAAPRAGSRTSASAPAASHPGSGAPALILSCWTRKDEKNWPLENWSVLLEFLLGEGRRPVIVVPPDGDADFRRFREKWRERVEFLEADLAGIHGRVAGAAGVLATDNFLGHMGAYLGKPVLWINGSSDPAHVSPGGPAGSRIVQVEPMPCRPCGHRCRNPVYKQCLRELLPETVIREARDWLERLPA